MRKTQTLAFVVSVVLVVGSSGCAGGPPRTTGQAGNGLVKPADSGRLQPGAVAIFPAGERTPVKPLQGELLDRTPFDPASVEDMVVVVNFWASWCAPCRAEAAELNAAAAATRKLDVRFVGVNIRDGRDSALSFVQGREEYPSIFDPAGRVVLEFADVSPNTIPATVIVDRQMRVAVVLRKAVAERELTSLIRQVAAENGGPGG